MRARVLRLVDVGEADRIVALITAESGRVDARVPHARRGRRWGALGAFVACDVELAPGHGSAKLASATVLPPAPPGDPLALAHGGFVAELLLTATPEGAASEDLFRLADAAFAALPAAGHEGWARGFELKLLHVLGARPALRRCVVCQEPADGALLWSPDLGGVVHALHGAPDGRGLDAETVRRLDDALRRPLADPGPPWPAEHARAGRDAMERFVAAHIGGRTVARRFLESLLAIGLTGCAPSITDARVVGFLFDGPEPDEDATPISGAVAVALGPDGAELGAGGEPLAAYPGYYRFDGLPIDADVTLSFSAGGQTTRVPLTTEAGELFVDAGVLHAFPADVVQGWRETWAPWLDTGAPGGVLRLAVTGSGQLRLGSTPLGCEQAGAPSDADSVGSGLCYAFGVPAGQVLLERIDGVPVGIASLWFEDGAVTSAPRVRLGGD